MARYQGRKFKEIEWPGPMPPCDFCQMQGARPIRHGVYDTPTVQGPWANACYSHMIQHSPKGCSIGYKRMRPISPPTVDSVDEI